MTSKIPLPGGSVADLFPDLAREAVEYSHTTSVRPGTHQLLEWSHTDPESGHYHTWRATPKDRIRGFGCPYCSTPMRKVLSGFNSLADINPELNKEYSKTNPTRSTEILANHSKKVWWLCKNNPEHSWEATPHQRNRTKSGCPFCAGIKVDPSRKNSLLHQFPELASEWHEDNHGNPEDYMVSAKYRAKWRCNMCSRVWSTGVYHRASGQGCRHCNTTGTSKIEQELYSFIHTLQPTAQNSVTGVVPPYELDVYIPETRQAFELDGIFWHSEKYKDRHSHANRLRACEASGVQLIQIWEDEWLYHREAVERMIKHKLNMSTDSKINTRKCSMESVSYDRASTFLQANHIQGAARGTVYAMLVSPEGEDVAVLVAKQKSKLNGAFYLERYATSARVPGGMPKLMKYVENLYEVDEWITFADLRVSTGDLYLKTGFVLDKTLPPDYTYLRRGARRREHKFNYRKDRFNRDPDLKTIPGLSEKELAALNGMFRVWDAGKSRYVKTR